MLKRFENKVVLVTGGGTGIGRAIASRIANEGAEVLIVGRTEATLQESSAQNQNINYVVADINKSEDIKSIIDLIKQKYNQLDVLINNAGVAPVTPLEETTLEEFDKVFGINTRGIFDLTKSVLPFLKLTQGNIINISTAIVYKPLANMSTYAGSKAALNMLTRVWAKELSTDRVRVNSVGVGPIETPIYEKTALSQDEAKAHVEAVKKTIPLGRFGQPEEVASLVAFLASNEAGFITGSDYPIDGGFGA